MQPDHLNALAIHAFYCGEHDAGRRACDRLLGLEIDERLERQTRANRTWYTPRLADLIPVTFARIEIEPAAPGWSLFNPTVISHAGRLLAIVRSSNYRIDEAGRYVIPPEDGDRIRTVNLLVDLDADLRPSSRREITLPDYERSGYPVEGFEDCRLRATPTGLAVSATVRDAAGWDGRCRIATADLDPATGALSRMRILEWEGLGHHEKNWAPIEGRQGWLYASRHGGHTVSVQADAGLPGVYEVLRHGTAPRLAGGFRGGSQLVRVRDGWLTVVHEVAVMESGRRAYEHRFLWFDDSLTLARWSPLFAFREPRSIEFAAGLARHGDGRLVVTFGVRDAEAWTADLSEDDVCRLLAPVS